MPFCNQFSKRMPILCFYVGSNHNAFVVSVRHLRPHHKADIMTPGNTTTIAYVMNQHLKSQVLDSLTKC